MTTGDEGLGIGWLEVWDFGIGAVVARSKRDHG